MRGVREWCSCGACVVLVWYLCGACVVLVWCLCGACVYLSIRGRDERGERVVL